MFKNTNHQGNVNKNYNEISLYAYQNVYYKKREETRARIWRKGNPSTWLGGMYVGTATIFVKILKTELTYDLEIPLLSIYGKEIKSLSPLDTCMSMFMATLLIIAKI